MIGTQAKLPFNQFRRDIGLQTVDDIHELPLCLDANALTEFNDFDYEPITNGCCRMVVYWKCKENNLYIMIASGTFVVDKTARKSVVQFTGVSFLDSLVEDQENWPVHKTDSIPIPPKPYFSSMDKYYYFEKNRDDLRFMTYSRYQKHIQAELFLILRNIEISQLVIEYVPVRHHDFIKWEPWENI